MRETLERDCSNLSAQEAAIRYMLKIMGGFYTNIRKCFAEFYMGFLASYLLLLLF